MKLLIDSSGVIGGAVEEEVTTASMLGRGGQGAR